MQTENPKMAKKSIGNIMRKRLSDITNSSQFQHENNNQPLSLDNNSIQQLLKERANLINLLADRNKMLERSGAELQRLRADMKKLQMQNWNLAQSNSLMLAELNLGRDKIKTLQHEILWRAALINGKTFNMQEKVEIESEKNASLSELKEEDEKEAHPSPITSNDEKQCCLNRRRIRSRSTGSSTASTSTKNTGKEKVKDKRRRSLRRHSATSKVHQHELLENLFEIEDAQYAITQSDKLSSSSVKTERRENTCLRNEAPRHSFGRPLRRAAEKVPSYKEIPLNVKMRRLA